MADKPKRHTKVVRLRILKPAGDVTWKELGALLRDVRYRVYRLANLAVSENYLNFHMFRTGRADTFEAETIGQLSRRLRKMLQEESEGRTVEQLDRISKAGATPETVHGALSAYKIRSITAPSKWRDVVRGKASLPTFRTDMAIPVRCDKGQHRRLERMPDGGIELDLQICCKPYPRVVLQTGDIGHGVRAILERLLANQTQSLHGYRQRVFEIKCDDRSKPPKWWLYVTYDFPAEAPPPLSPDIVVGVDLGVSCPLFAAINNGHARLGRRQFQALGARIRSLQAQIIARRRSMQRGGRVSLSGRTARSGHGRKRKLQPLEKLEGRINDAYNTLNHQLSAAVIDFAKNHGAGRIQIEDLSGLHDHLTGTFLAGRWRYHQLQQQLEYKGKQAGIEVRKVNPRYTSRRCSKCGFIHHDFDRQYRDAHRDGRRVARFKCPQCEYEADPDYNAARNIATLDVDRLIGAQCRVQGLKSAAL